MSGGTLQPCPFCRGEAEYERKGTAKASMIIVCSECGCRIESGDVFGFTKPENYFWNMRSDLAASELGEIADTLREYIRAANACCAHASDVGALSQFWDADNDARALLAKLGGAS